MRFMHKIGALFVSVIMVLGVGITTATAAPAPTEQTSIAQISQAQVVEAPTGIGLLSIEQANIGGGLPGGIVAAGYNDRCHWTGYFAAGYMAMHCAIRSDAVGKWAQKVKTPTWARYGRGR